MATRKEQEDIEKKTHKWTPDQVRHLIRFRTTNEENFNKKKYAAKPLWEKLIKELDLEGKVTTAQIGKKWEDLKKIYTDLKTPKTGSGTDSGEATAASWPFYEDMHEVLGSRPSIQPPCLLDSYEDPSQILMNIIDPPSSPVSSLTNSEESTENTCWKRASGPLSPRSSKKKKFSMLDFLQAEAAKEDRRCQKNEEHMDRFLNLLEKMVDQTPHQQ